VLEVLAIAYLLALASAEQEKMHKTCPEHPLYWDYVTHRGEPVRMVRLIYVDLVRAYRQDPPQRYGHQRKDTGYHTLREFEDLRSYIYSRFGLHVWQGASREQPNECWIWIPTTDSPSYRTDKTRWNTILRRWPKFLDPEFAVDG
jgi:hypothetical protein